MSTTDILFSTLHDAIVTVTDEAFFTTEVPGFDPAMTGAVDGIEVRCEIEGDPDGVLVTFTALVGDRVVAEGSRFNNGDVNLSVLRPL